MRQRCVVRVRLCADSTLVTELEVAYPGVLKVIRGMTHEELEAVLPTVGKTIAADEEQGPPRGCDERVYRLSILAVRATPLPPIPIPLDKRSPRPRALPACPCAHDTDVDAHSPPGGECRAPPAGLP